MKKFLFTIFFSIVLFNAFSAHIKGGFFTYEYLGPGIINPANLRYRITLTVYMSCFPSAGQLTNPINLTIFQGTATNVFANPSVNITSQYNLSKSTDEPCISLDQRGCYYTIVVYELNNYELPVSAAGYTVSYQRCCRIAGMENVLNSGSVGNTYSIKIPGTNSTVPNANRNTSPNFPVNDTAVVCGGSYFTYPISATDKDGDVLTYSLCSAYEGGSTAEAAPNPATSPPYSTLNYTSPFFATQPLGVGVTINSTTGLISGIAPIPKTFGGEFVVTVCVSEFRNGVFLGETRKELHIQVKDCTPVVAKLAPKGVTCDGFTVNFSNATTNPSGTTYTWDFGEPASGVNNSSALPDPVHVYSDTGIYIAKLTVSIGGLCTSSDSLIVRVYPGFFPDFNTIGPLCKGVPVSFADNTTTQYGVPTGWRWDFGNPIVTNDSSRSQNPGYTYSIPGTYNVQLIAGNTFGCVDTITKPVIIADNPVLTLISKDTSYCGADTLLLSAAGQGNFNWTPGPNIMNANTATPLVYPTVPTLYRVTLSQAGCISSDSVRVTPKNDLTNSITASATAICEDDTLTLTGNSNYSNNVSWSWGPATMVNDPAVKVTKAFPNTSVTFVLTTRLGRNCVATTTRNITVKPLALADAGPDQSICIGQTTARLSAGGGNTYQWLPVTGLSNPNISNPVASPASTTVYKVLVGVTGCIKTRIDSMQVLVRALPPITLTNDTLICSIDTLQLNAAGTGNFLWSPNVNISNLVITNPLVSPDLPTKYFTTLTDPFGCINRDSVFVDVKPFVTVSAGNDTTICRTDGIILNTTSDALSYNWTPATWLGSATDKRPLATPLDPVITYTVTGNIGKCQSIDQVTVRTVPYPVAHAGIDTIVCFGDSAPLNASGGSIYSWSPSIFLTATNIPNPVSIRPTTDTRYLVSVSDVLGCPKPVNASVWVRVYPIVNADAGPLDTSVVIGQPLLLNGNGGDNYLWSPSRWLNNPNIFNPLGFPEDNIVYKLSVSTAAGCRGTDSIRVKVFKVPPSFYVPGAFSPNNDRNNDLIRPILLGMRSLRFFRVYNRWGQLLFATSEKGKGWDGTFKGNPQDPGTYVWMTEGETYTGQVIKKQGTVVLLR
ncbi:MAG: gliding motility-associated C-terminal domain-containing protein [Ferruginibacter sp.]|nr:gliding motility-associated C-terminal domain-containing protein [Ferruginibacter sp.]